MAFTKECCLSKKYIDKNIELKPDNATGLELQRNLLLASFRDNDKALALIQVIIKKLDKGIVLKSNRFDLFD